MRLVIEVPAAGFLCDSQLSTGMETVDQREARMEQFAGIVWDALQDGLSVAALTDNVFGLQRWLKSISGDRDAFRWMNHSHWDYVGVGQILLAARPEFDWYARDIQRAVGIDLILTTGPGQ